MIIQGDALKELKKLKPNSVDAVVTDPPYGLEFMGKKWDKFKKINSGRKREVNEITAISRGPEKYEGGSTLQEFVANWATECLRVLKPGGYLLSFAGTRTQHRIAAGIEDAGFEIRDMIAWVYGSGFPKSLNIGKAVDKLQGNERKGIEPTGRYKYSFKDHKGKFVNTRDADGNVRVNVGLTKGTSEWEGWGTALKPALEPITVARKPLSEKTVAENVLKWGTGGIDIDGCRVGYTQPGEAEFLNKRSGSSKSTIWQDDAERIKLQQNTQGRFPANLIHDGSDEVVELFPNTVPTSYATNKTVKGGMFNYPGHGTEKIRDETRSASRFFYCAKASKSERNMGCEGLEEKTKSHITSQNFENALTGSGNIRNIVHKNNHPTVKPIALMEYLVKLVSRKGATVLDPFAGSGSTGIACKKLDREFIGIEREEDYCKIAEARINSISEKLI